MTSFSPKFTTANRMTAAITRIERARGFLEAAQLSADWVRDMGDWALILEAHHTTHEGAASLTDHQSSTDQATYRVCPNPIQGLNAKEEPSWTQTI